MARLIPTLVLAAGFAIPLAAPLSAQQARNDGGPAAEGPRAQEAPEAREVPETTVLKTAAALREIAGIRRSFEQQSGTASTPDQQRGLAEQANREMARAISRQGLSVDEYNRVIQLAQADQGLRDRVLAATRVQ